ncbi:hypothetical protein pb186bvf_003795 [Paramecium bursaria]
MIIKYFFQEYHYQVIEISVNNFLLWWNLNFPLHLIKLQKICICFFLIEKQIPDNNKNFEI